MHVKSFNVLALDLLSVYASFLLSIHKTALTSERNIIIFRPLLTYNSINRRAIFLIFYLTNNMVDPQHLILSNLLSIRTIIF